MTNSTEIEESPWAWLHRFPVLNLRCILRSIAYFGTLSIIGLLAVELGTATWGYMEISKAYQEDLYGSCKNIGGKLWTPIGTWHLYFKLQSLCFSVWLLIKLCKIVLPLFGHSSWLYRNQEKMLSYRTSLIIIAFFNILPLLILVLYECMATLTYSLWISIAVWLSVILDRIFVFENDYYLLLVGDNVDKVPKKQWQKWRWHSDSTATKEEGALLVTAQE